MSIFCIHARRNLTPMCLGAKRKRVARRTASNIPPRYDVMNLFLLEMVFGAISVSCCMHSEILQKIMYRLYVWYILNFKQTYCLAMLSQIRAGRKSASCNGSIRCISRRVCHWFICVRPCYALYCTYGLKSMQHDQPYIHIHV